MGVRFQVVVDCADPHRQAHFWAAALGYRIADPPAGFADWDAYWRSVGVPEEELGDGGDDRIVDPDGGGPAIWFQRVPEGKVAKNRLHFDVTVSGGRAAPLPVRRSRVDAEADRLVALGATKVRALDDPSIDHYAMAMLDPEGNEFDIN